MRRGGRFARVGPTLIIALLVSCGGEEPVGTSSELTARLAEAAPGDTITLSEGRFEGRFVVPPGVTVVGAGRGLTEVVAPSDSAALVLEPGASATPTAIESMTVVGGGSWVVMARGAGHARVARVDVRAPGGGAGVGIEDLDAITLDGVTVTGPVTEANAGGVPPRPDVSATALDGIALVNVASATMIDVGVRGFAAFGVESIESTLTWSGGYVRESLGTGLMVYGGRAELDGVQLTGALAGVRMIPAYNALFAAGAVVTSNAVEVSASGGYGLVHIDSEGQHEGLVATGNFLAGAWIQGCDGVSVNGAVFDGNGVAGVAIMDSVNVSVSNTDVRATQLRTRVIGVSPVEVADGLLVSAGAVGLELDALSLENNERVGLLFDLDGGDMSGVSLSAITITGSAEQLGAIAQNGMVPPGWDAQIERRGSTLDNDPGFIGTLEVVEVVTPSDLPVDSAAISAGIDGVVTPSD